MEKYNYSIQNTRMDRYLRNPDTLYARALKHISAAVGKEYLQSRTKRLVDLTVSVPAAIISIPAIAVLGTAKKLEDGGSIFYKQKRYGQSGRLDVYKIRSMQENADKQKDAIQAVNGKTGHEDPRATIVGRVLRKYGLDELPQLFQIISGQMSISGVRPMSVRGMRYLKETWSEERYKSYRKIYSTARVGLTGLHQSRGNNLKRDNLRYHHDRFYTQRASLGFDLYILWKTMKRLRHGH